MKIFYNIQGLRGLAVISVIFFHYGFEYFQGGFLGVDIFFVISGYLMSLILDKKISYKTLLNFYLKRLKRILPALIFVVFISLLLGFLLISESSYERLGKTSLSSIFFTSNFYYWREWGYFDLNSLNKPLLHTWSLSVEMQFYLLFPILLLSINFFFKKINIIYKLIFIIISFTFFTELIIEEKKIASFYLMPFRLSEFLIGSIGYYYEKNYKTLKINKNYVFILSLGLLLFCILYYDKNIKFPGLNSLLPCIITLILILNKENYLSKKILQNKILLFIGNISYSLYLIHWPLFIYYRFYTFKEPSNAEKFLLIILSIIFAYLINKYIENVFKKKNNQKNNFFYSFSYVVIAIFSISVIFNNGYDFRIKNKKNLYNNNEVKNFINDDLNKEKLFYKKCVINSNSKDIDFIFLGDSHAVMYAPGILEFSKKNKKNFCFVSLLVTCNFFGGHSNKDFIKTNCYERQRVVIDYLSKIETSTLVIAHAWHVFDNEDFMQIAKKYDSFYKKIFKENKKNIIFLLSVPEFSNGISGESCTNFPKYLVKNRNCDYASRNSKKIENNHSINEKINFEISQSKMGNIFFLNPYDYLCDNRLCKQVINNNDVYSDRDHLTNYTGKLLINFWQDDLINIIE